MHRLMNSLVFVLAVSQWSIAGTEAGDSLSLRLGSSVVPISEKIILTLDPSRAAFTGSAEILLNVRTASNVIRFHARDIELSSVVLRGSRGEVGTRLSTEETGLVDLTANTILQTGSYSLIIGFQSQYNNARVGLFREGKGEDSYVFSMFEPFDARRAFPCWDEPCFKIPYQITVKIPEGHTAISNTPIQHETLEQGIKTVTFEETPPLPSYLLAVATGPFEIVRIEGASVPVRVVTMKGRARYAADLEQSVPRILSALERYFGIPYPFEKLDLIAVPGVGWAMENAGAVTFGESIILFDDKTASSSKRSFMAWVVAHELAHMWFGDLVTMGWWDDLWLNESFASWMGDKVMDEVFPEYRSRNRQLNDADVAMTTDAGLTTHAIRRAVSPRQNMSDFFDEITYQKGDAVLGMFENWMGREDFARGVVDYLNAHRWGNANASDFLDALSHYTHGDIRKAFRSFLEQPGVPLVSLRTLDNNRLEITQKRFMDFGLEDSLGSRWDIPMTLRIPIGNSSTRVHFLLTRGCDTLRLPVSIHPRWIEPDDGEMGYYRWRVPPEASAMTLAAGSKSLTVRERIGLLKNLHALVTAGLLGAAEYLQAIAALARDPDPDVVSASVDAAWGINIDYVEESTEAEGLYAPFLRDIFGQARNRYGLIRLPGDSEPVRELRQNLLFLLGKAGGDPAVLQIADSLAWLHLKDPSAVDPSLGAAALRLAAYAGNEILFDSCRVRYEACEDPSERSLLLSVIGSFNDSMIAGKALRYALSERVSPMQAFYIANSASGNQDNREMVFQWVLNNYDTLAHRVGDVAAYLPLYAWGASRERIETANSFFRMAQHSIPGTAYQLQKVTDEVRRCLALREREGASVMSILRKYTAPLTGRSQ